MTRADVLADLEKRFAEHVAGDIAEMRSAGFSEAYIAAVYAECRRIYEAQLPAALAYVFQEGADVGQTRH